MNIWILYLYEYIILYCYKKVLSEINERINHLQRLICFESSLSE